MAEYRALYRVARPARFSEVIGQDAVVQTLKSQVMSGRIGHAYLFSGPRGVGKTTIARIFARAVNCEHPTDGEMCGECATCRALAGENNMDIIEIDAASNNGVDNIRDLRENVGYLPAHGKYRIYIIDEVHMLSTSAFNALLKTLEEPPAHVIFIMATTEMRKLPDTVISRCQRYEFRRMTLNQMTGHMRDLAEARQVTVDPKGLTAIARAAQGAMRDAITLLDQCLSTGETDLSLKDVYRVLGSADRRSFYTLARKILSGNTAEAIQTLRTMLDDGAEVTSLAAELLRTMGDIFTALHIRDVASALDVDEGTAQALTSLARDATPSGLIRILRILALLEGELRYAGQPTLLLEIAVARCCEAEETKSPEALLERIQLLENRVRDLEARPAGTVVVQSVNEAQPAFDDACKVPSFEEEVFAEPDTEEPFVTEPEEPVPEPEEELPMPVDDLPPWEVPQDFDEPVPADELPEVPTEEPASAAEPEKTADPAKPMDLASLRNAARSAAASREEPSAEELSSPRALWEAAIRETTGLMETQMKRGRPVALEEGLLTVAFLGEESMALRGLKRKGEVLDALLTKVAGKPIRVEVREEKFTRDEQEFVDKSMSRIPADLITIETDSTDF